LLPFFSFFYALDHFAKRTAAGAAFGQAFGVARFYMTRILPQTSSLFSTIMAGTRTIRGAGHCE
jgi:hypothetical protein